MEKQGSHAALAGIRVVDMTQFESGTICTLTLAWMGAEVIKVEPPEKGEQARYDNEPGIDSHYFISFNANKKSVTCNLKTPQGRKLMAGLIEQGDIFVENFGPGVIEKLGFGYEDVKKINPRMIYARIKGYAPEGPYGQFLAFDPVVQAAGGALSITGEPNGRPIKSGPNFADSVAGLHCTAGILGALHQRHSTGRGQLVEISMQDGLINCMRVPYAAQAMTGKPAPRTANQSIFASTAPSEVYRCKGDGQSDYIYIYSTRANNKHWESLLALMNRNDLANDPRFQTPRLRADHAKEVDAIVSEWTRNYDKRDLMEMLGKAGVPAGAVFNTVELSSDPHLHKRGTFVTVEHPQRGKLTIPGNMIKLSDSQVRVESSPLLGADNEAVYGGILGVTAGELEQLRQDKAI